MPGAPVNAAERRIVRRLREAGALRPGETDPLEGLRGLQQRRLAHLVARGVVREAAPGLVLPGRRRVGRVCQCQAAPRLHHAGDRRGRWPDHVRVERARAIGCATGGAFRHQEFRVALSHSRTLEEIP